MKRGVRKTNLKRKSPRRRVAHLSTALRTFLSVVLALPFIIGGVWFAQANWIEPNGIPPANNLSGPVWLQLGATTPQTGKINVSDEIKSGSINTGNILAVPAIGDAVYALAQDVAGAVAVHAVGTGTSVARTAWAGYFGKTGTAQEFGIHDGSIFAKEYCSPGANFGDAPVCTSSLGSSGSGGDLWAKVSSSGNDIYKKPAAGIVTIGDSTVSSSLPSGTKLVLTGDGSNGPRLYLSNSKGNPEIDLQISNTNPLDTNDYWSIFASKDGSANNPRELVLWAKDKATGTGDNRFSFSSDGIMTFKGWNPPTYMVNVSKGGTAASAGLVTGGAVAINCGNTCSGGAFPGTQVTLLADAQGNQFDSWSNGTGPAAVCNNSASLTCQFTLSTSADIKANFTLLYNITLSKLGTGTGRVTSNPAGIDCTSTCSSQNATFTANTVVTLTATPSGACLGSKCNPKVNASTFANWFGGCTPVPGNPNQCTVTVNQALNIQAEFGGGGGGGG